jgi:hypothetical protein
MFDSLDDILEQPTQVRSELTTNNQQEMTNFSSLEF